MNNNNLLLAKHAANGYGGWVKIVRMILSHKPMALAAIERVTV